MKCLVFIKEIGKYIISGIYVFIADDELRTVLKYYKYFILTESDDGFHNIVVSNLFNCMRVNETAYAIIVIKLINNKLASQDS
jgi:hypothetical protein